MIRFYAIIADVLEISVDFDKHETCGDDCSVGEQLVGVRLRLRLVNNLRKDEIEGIADAAENEEDYAELGIVFRLGGSKRRLLLLFLTDVTEEGLISLFR